MSKVADMLGSCFLQFPLAIGTSLVNSVVVVRSKRTHKIRQLQKKP